MSTFVEKEIGYGIKLGVHFSYAKNGLKLPKDLVKAIRLKDKREQSDCYLTWQEKLLVKWYVAGYTAPAIRKALNWSVRYTNQRIQELNLGKLKRELKRERKGRTTPRRKPKGKLS